MPQGDTTTVYLDTNATAPLAASARREIARWLKAPCANPSSPHADARRLRAEIEHARRRVARALGALPSQITFTSGATESIYAALHTAFAAMRPRWGTAPPTVVLSAIEHAATRGAAGALERAGAQLRWVSVGAAGFIDPERVAHACASAPAVVSILAAHNETGVLQPISALRPLLPPGALLHVDAAQLWGKLPLSLHEWGADYVSLSGHKIGAPPGVGVLWAAPGAPPPAWCAGGNQEGGRRGGTENVPAILALGAVAQEELGPNVINAPEVARRRDRLEAAALALGDVEVNGTGPRLPNTTHLFFRGVEAEELLLELDARGVRASSGSACTSMARQPSPSLLAMGRSAAEAASCVRFSLGPATTDCDIDAACAALEEAVNFLRLG